MRCERCGAEDEHPGFVHMPDYEVTAARRALSLARSMVLAGERMSEEADAQIMHAIHALVLYDTSRPEPEQSPAFDLLCQVVRDYAETCCDHLDTCDCSMARAYRRLEFGLRNADVEQREHEHVVEQFGEYHRGR